MSGYLKNTLGVRQMVTNGNEGYRTRGVYDPFSPITYPYQNYLNSGFKGELSFLLALTFSNALVTASRLSDL